MLEKENIMIQEIDFSDGEPNGGAEENFLASPDRKWDGIHRQAAADAVCNPEVHGDIERENWLDTLVLDLDPECGDVDDIKTVDGVDIKNVVEAMLIFQFGLTPTPELIVLGVRILKDLIDPYVGDDDRDPVWPRLRLAIGWYPGAYESLYDAAIAYGIEQLPKSSRRSLDEQIHRYKKRLF